MIAEDYYFLQIIKKFYGGTLQMAEIWTMGEVLVEIMRPEIDQKDVYKRQLQYRKAQCARFQ